ncbi:hypothetical protein PAXINDRAFT_76278, partial [Paxillus involutus ATCC 200175]
LDFCHFTDVASERDEVRRADFIASLQNDFIGDASEFVVVDETSKNERTYARHYGRAVRGHRAHICDVFACGDRYSLCAALTVDGYLAARAIEGSYDTEEFYDFIAEEDQNGHSHRQLPHMNPYPQGCSVLVLDNCRIHHNEDLVDLVESAGT